MHDGTTPAINKMKTRSENFKISWWASFIFLQNCKKQPNTKSSRGNLTNETPKITKENPRGRLCSAQEGSKVCRHKPLCKGIEGGGQSLVVLSFPCIWHVIKYNTIQSDPIYFISFHFIQRTHLQFAIQLVKGHGNWFLDQGWYCLFLFSLHVQKNRCCMRLNEAKVSVTFYPL